MGAAAVLLIDAATPIKYSGSLFCDVQEKCNLPPIMKSTTYIYISNLSIVNATRKHYDLLRNFWVSVYFGLLTLFAFSLAFDMIVDVS